MSLFRAEWILKGRVQGVFCRANTRRVAREISAKGYVKNLSDGTVRVMAESEDKNKLLEMKQKIKDFDSPRNVKEIKGGIKEVEEPRYSSFSIKY